MTNKLIINRRAICRLFKLRQLNLSRNYANSDLTHMYIYTYIYSTIDESLIYNYNCRASELKQHAYTSMTEFKL